MLSMGIIRGLGAACALVVSVDNAVAQSEPATPAPEPTAVAQATSFRLVQIAGQALPALVEKEWRCEEHITEAQLTLAADSTWTLRSTTRETCGDRRTDDTDTETGRYTVAGQTVRFTSDTDDDRDDRDDDIDIDDLGTGTLGADGGLAATLTDGRTKLVFQR
jgi:hypothetical protein